MGIGSRSGVTGTGGGVATAVDITAIGGVPVTAAPKTDGMSAGTAVMEVGARDEVFNGVSWDQARGGIDAVGAFLGYQNVLPYAIFHAAPTLRADGDAGPLEADTTGRLKVLSTPAVLGQQTMVNSAPVVIASDQSPIDENVARWGGVAVAAAAAMGDVESNASIVPRVGTRASFLNVGGTWDIARSGSTGDVASVVGFQNTLPYTTYHAVPPTVTDGHSIGLQSDVNGNLKVTGTVTSSPSVVGGGTEAAAQRVTIANDSTGLLSVDDNGGSLTVDTPQLPAALVGGRLDVNLGASGATVTTTVAAPSLFTNFGTDPDVSVKGSAGVVLSFSCHNLNGSARYAQLHNKASAPSAGDTPLLTFLIPTGAMIVIGTDFFTQAGIAFGTGIAFGFSTTEATYTAGTNTDQFTQITYI